MGRLYTLAQVGGSLFEIGISVNVSCRMTSMSLMFCTFIWVKK